jgi:lactoylglutathione lyase
VKTLHTAYRVSHLARSLDFYLALGYEEVGRVVGGAPGATLIMLKLPDDKAVTLELVYEAQAGPVQTGGFSHMVVQVEELDTTLAALSQAGLSPDPPQHPAGPNGPYTAFLTDPDGYRIELVEWPPGHTDGMTAADFA